MRFLIATWGDPRGWGMSEYEVDGQLLKAASTTKALREFLEPQRTLIIAWDSLGWGSTYQELKSSAERVVREKLEEWELEAEVLVAPGRGRFKLRGPEKTISIEGDALDFYYFVFYQTAKRVMEAVPEGEGEPLEVILDLSHGVNFAPVLTYRAIREILAVLSLWENRRSLLLKVYNSDPYYRNGLPRLRVNLIEECSVPPSLSVSLPEDYDHNGKFEGVGVEDALVFLGAVQSGLPLLVFSAFPDPDSLLEALESHFRRWLEGAQVSVSGSSSVEVRRSKRLKQEVRIFTLAWLLSEGLLRAGLARRQREVLLKEIKSLANVLYRFNRLFSDLIKYEVDDISRKISGTRNLPEARWVPYSSLFGNEEKTPSFHRRNFFAHAGLSRSEIEVRKEGDGVWIRYSEKGLEDAKGAALKQLKRLKRSPR